MNDTFRQILVSFLCAQLSVLGMTLEECATRRLTQPPGLSELSTGAGPKEPTPLRRLLQKPYAELFDLAPTFEFSPNEIQSHRNALEKGEDFCLARFKDHAKQYARQIETVQKDLKVQTVSLNEGQRQQVHCKIQNLELLRSEAQALSSHAIPTAYDNLNAKLDLVEKWPAFYKKTQQEIANGTYLNRRWGDVKDIGFREIAANLMRPDTQTN
jgi:hypothetical protein